MHDHHHKPNGQPGQFDQEDFHGEVVWVDPERAAREEEDVEGLEKFSLRSVGIDIGSSTSHLVFSHLTLRREGANLSARFTVTEREVLFRSRILLTPYLGGTLIDVDKLTEFFDAAYHEAGLTPRDVDTGAVVITGEALKKENARPILEYFASHSGKFICASAGPNHEALLAAYGSGAVALSEQVGGTVLSVDIGGGTSKLSLIKNGTVEQTASVEVGARLIAFDESGVVTRVEQPARVLMRHLGSSVELGEQVEPERRKRFVELMARCLFEVVRGDPLAELTRQLMLTEPLDVRIDEARHIVFSGGVSEYIYGYETRPYGDLGDIFGAAIREEVARLSRPDVMKEPAEGIRATVIGAGEYTVQVSGITSYISNAEALPVFGLKVVRPVLEANGSFEGAFRKALAKFDLDSFTSGLALAISLDATPTYRTLRSLAESIVSVVNAGTNGASDPLFLVMDMDVAKSLGGILKEELRLGREVIAVDGVDVGDLDYVDIGRPMGISEALPVTVKSLLFPVRTYA
jgi:ethanolamine utilization protein EutA